MGSLVEPVDPVPLPELGRVHFTGIGGAGMSGIARIMIARGVKVSGSDAADSELLTARTGPGSLSGPATTGACPARRFPQRAGSWRPPMPTTR